MKQIVPTLLLALAPFTVAAQSTLGDRTGAMDCKVKSNDVLTISEGKERKYTGYTDQFKVGDSLRFEYSLRPADGILYMMLVDRKRDEAVDSKFIVSPVENFNSGSNGGFWRYTLFNGSNQLEEASFSKDYIRFRGIRYDLRLKRYYKGDWQGMAVMFHGANTDELEAHVFTLDCRHEIDAVEAIVEFLLSKNSK